MAASESGSGCDPGLTFPMADELPASVRHRRLKEEESKEPTRTIELSPTPSEVAVNHRRTLRRGMTPIVSRSGGIVSRGGFTTMSTPLPGSVR